MISTEFNTIHELLEAFPDEQSCIDHLTALRWEYGGVVSPFEADSKVYKCANNRYRCKATGKYFNVKTSTLFDNTRVKLKKWFMAIWLVTLHNQGISSVQLAKDIGVTQRTAWFMLQRIRNCFGSDNDKDNDLNNELDVDETRVEGKAENKRNDKQHTNRMKSVWGLLNYGTMSAYHSVSIRRLQCYVNECLSRYQARNGLMGLGVKPLLLNAENRLTCEGLINAQ